MTNYCFPHAAFSIISEKVKKPVNNRFFGGMNDEMGESKRDQSHEFPLE